MPYTKLSKDSDFKKVDFPTAVLLYRKAVLNLSWDDIGAKCGYKGDSIRRMFMVKSSADLPVSLVRDALKAVGLDYRNFLDLGAD